MSLFTDGLNKFKGFAPITARLFDVIPAVYPKENIAARTNAANNFKALVVAATLTRIIIGFARIMMDHPRFNHSEASQNDKWKTMIERINIEFFGTLGYIVALAAGQDVAAAIRERSKDLKPEALLNGIINKLPETAVAEKNAIIQAFENVYQNPKPGHLFDKVLNGGNLFREFKEKVRTGISQESFTAVEEAINGMSRKLNRNATLVVGAGLLTSALFGGVAMQLFNDFVISPFIVPGIMKMFGLKGDGKAAPREYPMPPALAPLTLGSLPQNATPMDQVALGAPASQPPMLIPAYTPLRYQGDGIHNLPIAQTQPAAPQGGVQTVPPQYPAATFANAYRALATWR